MVRGVHPQIEAILATEGVIRVADHPHLRSSLSRLAVAGLLDNPLPGLYRAAGECSNLGWLAAVSAWAGPAGAIHGRSAASVWLPELVGPVAHLAHPTLGSRRGVVVSRRSVPREFVVQASGVRLVSPAFAAVELAATDDGRAICEALRRKLADPASLASALSAQRGAPGTAERRTVVAACAGNPWSYAELRLHRILCSGGIVDWVANRPLRIGGRVLIPDVRLRSCRLVIQFDGREVHDNRAQFLADREWLNTFEAAGYHVLRFGWEHLDDPGYILAATRSAARNARPVRGGWEDPR